MLDTWTNSGAKWWMQKSLSSNAVKGMQWTSEHFWVTTYQLRTKGLQPFYLIKPYIGCPTSFFFSKSLPYWRPREATLVGMHLHCYWCQCQYYTFGQEIAHIFPYLSWYQNLKTLEKSPLTASATREHRGSFLANQEAGRWIMTCRLEKRLHIA